MFQEIEHKHDYLRLAPVYDHGLKVSACIVQSALDGGCSTIFPFEATPVVNEWSSTKTSCLGGRGVVYDCLCFKQLYLEIRHNNVHFS